MHNQAVVLCQYKMFSTRLAYVYPTSEELNGLRHAISTEPSTEGAQILWERLVLTFQIHRFLVFSKCLSMFLMFSIFVLSCKISLIDLHIF